MKTEIKVTKEVEITTLEINAKVRYWEDATINGVEDENGDLTPCKNGEMWQPVINIDTGVITNWKQGVKADVHFKVCDAGSYYLKDAEDNTVLAIEQDYVPKIACPKENGYGDYIIMDIDENGQIANWKPNIDDFKDEEDDC